MSRDTVLVIGAGASYGARPMDPRPPRGAELAAYLLQWFDENRPQKGDREWGFRMSMPLNADAPAERLFDDDPDIRPILVAAVERSRSSATAFEEVMADLLRDHARSTLTKVNEVICFALLGGRASVFMPQRDLYDELFARLRPRLRCIVTPNYDLLAEEALSRTGLSYRYREIANGGDADAAVVIDKFHGSVNWFQPIGPAAGHSWASVAERAKPLQATPQRNMPSFHNAHPVHAVLDRVNAFLQLKQLLGGDPVLVTYGPGKDAMFGRHCLDRVRAACAEELVRTPPPRVIVAGISPPRGGGDDDAWETLCLTFARLGSAKEYWSRDPVEQTKMASYGFTRRDGWLAELVASLPTP